MTRSPAQIDVIDGEAKSSFSAATPWFHAKPMDGHCCSRRIELLFQKQREMAYISHINVGEMRSASLLYSSWKVGASNIGKQG